ncbi:hypothetical protein A4A49_39572 [Nicotiana attenuata]|uniref:Uncharacterized protein n=1 Tax=Nicotiana attenuata TaxID=49451 RepID=A0A1J6KC42_NICAT|nr:hypothetical protein A4A49_39572 [Nicotiana attenuata]
MAKGDTAMALFLVLFMAFLASGEQVEREVSAETTWALIPVGWFPFGKHPFKPKWIPLGPVYPFPLPAWFIPFHFGPWSRNPHNGGRKFGPGFGSPDLGGLGPELEVEPDP